MKQPLGFIFLLTIALPAWSQTVNNDSLRMLEEVRVVDSRLSQFASGDKVSSLLPQTIGSVTHDRLSNLLMQYSAVNVRSYGPSGLSTASLRGAGSNHAAVFWEGINLQSSMNGSLNLTLVPMSFIDEVSLQFGGAGALYGSGTLGGAIHLESDGTQSSLGWHGQLYQQVGSFGQRYTGINAGYRTEKWSTYARWFTQQADYDYPFFNRYTQRQEHRQNAGIAQQGVLLEQSWTPNAANSISAKYWYQDNRVQIPAVAAAGGEAQAVQTDNFHRAVVHWNHVRRNQTRSAAQRTASTVDAAQWQVRSALLYHRLAYDNRVNIRSDDRAVSWITEGEHTYYINNRHWLHSGINYTYESAVVRNYATPVMRHRLAPFVSYRARILPTLEATVGARETLIDGAWSPFMPSLSVGYQALPAWLLKAKAARSYRIPTFNDLYWSGGSDRGNPNLLPEQGWTYELGVAWQKKFSQETQASAELTAFNNCIDRWIQWLPDSLNRWSPVNVDRVWARGVEWEGSLEQQFASQFSLRLWTSYTYTKATKERIDAGGSLADLHQQLIYTPLHQANASANITYRTLTAGYSWMHIGEQFTKGNNLRSLPAYSVHDVSLTFRWPVSLRHRLLINGQLNNLWNRAYDVREGYPMPGRNYQLSITYQFNQQPSIQ